MKILLINAHPDYQNPARTINQLVQHSLATIEKIAPTDSVEQLTLYDPTTAIPPVSATSLNHPESVYNAQQALIQQWKSADVILILMPLHNFNVVSKLKDYIDDILVAKETFKYTADGSVGLLDGHQKVAYIQSSGSDYEHDLRYVNADFAPHYMRTVLDFMGISKMTLIRAEGLDLADSNKIEIIENTKKQLTDYLTKTLS